MATYEKDGRLKFKDASGNLYELSPATRAELVELNDGSNVEDALASLNSEITEKVNTDFSNANTEKLVEVLKEEGVGGGGLPIVAATGDGATYTATVDGVTALEVGYSLTIIPDTTSTTTLPKLNLNGLGAKNIKQRLSQNTALTVQAQEENWLVANKPVTLTYDGMQWVTSFARPAVNDLYGDLPGGSASYLATIGTEWTEDEETGVKYQIVSVPELTGADDEKPFVDHTDSSIDGTSDGYALFVEEENEYLTYITNGRAESVQGGIRFEIFGDANTIEIPIEVRVG